MEWIISANSKKYDHATSFIENDGVIYWRQKKYKFNKGDIIYIYCAKPYMKIMYKCQVIKINIEKSGVGDTTRYWQDIEAYNDNNDGPYMKVKLLEYTNSEALKLYKLRNNGINGNPQGRIIVKDKRLSDYIRHCFLTSSVIITDNEVELHEGGIKTGFINRYERSKLARTKCLEHHGISCKVCLISFEKFYGEIGKNYIHVHHIEPISTKREAYIIDYKKDLIPVCPNCHAMLHKKLNNKSVSVEQLKNLIEQKNPGY